MECIQERAFYYWRHGLYGHVQIICADALKKKSSNLFLTMFISLSKAKLGDIDEAIENLSKMKNRKDLLIVYDICMYCINTCNKEKKNDIKDIQYLTEAKNLKSTNSLALFYATEVAWLFNIPDIYEPFLEFSKKDEEENNNMKTLNAWILITKGKFEEAFNMLDQSTDEYIRRFDIMALYAKIICHSYFRQFSESGQIISRVLSKFDFPELNVEKCRIYMAMEKWAYTKNIIADSKSILFSTFESNYFEAIEGLYNGRDILEVVSTLDMLMVDILTYEKANWPLILNISFSLLTICAQNLTIIDKILKMVMIAYDISINNPDCANVLGFCHLYTHNYVAALNVNQSNSFTQNQNINITPFPMEFQIRLLIETGRYSEAQDMLDMYKLVETHNMIFYILQSKLLRKMNNSNESILLPLLESLKVHITSFKNDPLPFGEENCLEVYHEQICNYFIRFRIDSILEAFEELTVQNFSLVYSLKKMFSNDLIPVLEPVQKNAPNYNPFCFYLAIVYDAAGKPDDAINYLHKILLSPTVYKLPECLTIAGRIFFEKNDIDLAIECIKGAYNEDSSLLQSIEFLILKSKVTSTMKETIPNIIQLFEKNSTSSKIPFSTYLNFIDLCFSAEDYQTASKFIRIATKLVSNNFEKFLLILRQVKSYALRHDEEKALLSIEKLKKHKKYESDLVLAKSEIYYDFLKDNSKYISVLQNYANEVKTSKAYMILGDGLCKIKNFSLALDAYKRSLRKSENDTVIIKKLILCLLSAHRFSDAIGYFSSYSLLLRNEYLFCMHFIKLMIEMKRYEEALQCLNKVKKSLYSFISLTQIEYFVLTGEIQAQLNNYKESSDSFNQAVDSYSKLLENAKNNTNSYTLHIKRQQSEIIYQIGVNFLSQNDRQKALEKFNYSLELNPRNSSSVIALFNLYKGRSEIEKCQKICMEYLTVDPTNETIALLFTSSQTTDLFKSIPYLQKVIDAHPYYFRALVRLVEICARCGRLSIAYDYIQKSKCNEPGYYFVRGLYAQYTGNNQKANSLYRKATSSQKWEIPAKVALFSLLVNPDRKFVIFEDQALSSENNLKEAEILLKTIHTDEATIKLLYCDLLLSNNTKETISEAYSIYSDLSNRVPGLISSFLGQARCLTKQGDFDKANDIITTILSGNTFHENFSYFEESYLIRAYIISLKTNYNSAQNYIYLAIGLNRCCKKAWEMCAEINLKRKMYQEAANAFKFCWELCDKKDLEIGYNYAYCSMKSKDYETALITCREVLNDHPEYKDLKEKVMIPSYLKIKD